MNQQALWHDSPEEALRALIDALGGPKAVGHMLMPEKSMDDARRFAAFLLNQAGYDEPRPIEPRDELAELQRDFIRAVNEQKALVERMQRVQVRAAS